MIRLTIGTGPNVTTHTLNVGLSVGPNLVVNKAVWAPHVNKFKVLLHSHITFPNARTTQPRLSEADFLLFVVEEDTAMYASMQGDFYPLQEQFLWRNYCATRYRASRRKRLDYRLVHSFNVYFLCYRRSLLRAKACK